MVDSGFTGHLSLPEEAVDLLGLEFDDIIDAKLANDSMVRVRVYEETILWDDEERVVRVLATGERPLLGTALLAGSSLYAEFIENGYVEVKPLAVPREVRGL